MNSRLDVNCPYATSAAQALKMNRKRIFGKNNKHNMNSNVDGTRSDTQMRDGTVLKLSPSNRSKGRPDTVLNGGVIAHEIDDFGNDLTTGKRAEERKKEQS